MAVRKKSNNHCSVYGCNTYYFSNKSISFHQLPNRNEPKILHKNNFVTEELVDRRRIWEIVLKLSKKALSKKRIQICSKHFTENYFFSSGKLFFNITNTFCKKFILNTILPFK